MQTQTVSLRIPGDFTLHYHSPVAEAAFSELQVSVESLLAGLFDAHQALLTYAAPITAETIVEIFLNDWHHINQSAAIARARPHLLQLAHLVLRIAGTDRWPVEQVEIHVYPSYFILDLQLAGPWGQRPQTLCSTEPASAHRDALPIGIV